MIGGWFFISGAIIGSFMNVLIYRIPRGFRINLPSRSACIKCKHKLTWHENIPLFSYLILGGRCKYCRKKIGYRYPLVELLGAILFLAVYKNFGLSTTTIYYCILATILISVTFIDLDFFIIPDSLSLSGIALGLLGSIFIEDHSFVSALLGAFFGGFIFWLLGWAYYQLTSREGLGFGDVKLLAMIGAFTGIQGVFFTIVLSSLIGSLVGIVVMLVRRENLKMAIPYGPFLAIGALAHLFWGEYLVFRFYPF